MAARRVSSRLAAAVASALPQAAVSEPSVTSALPMATARVTTVKDEIAPAPAVLDPPTASPNQRTKKRLPPDVEDDAKPPPKKRRKKTDLSDLTFPPRALGSTKYIGSHVSASGGVEAAPINAALVGGRAFGLFLSPFHWVLVIGLEVTDRKSTAMGGQAAVGRGAQALSPALRCQRPGDYPRGRGGLGPLAPYSTARYVAVARKVADLAEPYDRILPGQLGESGRRQMAKELRSVPGRVESARRLAVDLPLTVTAASGSVRHTVVQLSVSSFDKTEIGLNVPIALVARRAPARVKKASRLLPRASIRLTQQQARSGCSWRTWYFAKEALGC
jgi:hypothetical protein